MRAFSIFQLCLPVLTVLWPSLVFAQIAQDGIRLLEHSVPYYPENALVVGVGDSLELMVTLSEKCEYVDAIVQQNPSSQFGSDFIKAAKVAVSNGNQN
jgi:hypothetical protein